MKRGLIFSGIVVSLLLAIFVAGLHLLVVDYRHGIRELARRKGEIMARDMAMNLGHNIRERISSVGLLSTTLFPFYLEGKISRGELDRGVALHMKYGGGVTNIQYFDRSGVGKMGYPRGRALVGIRLDRDLKNREFYQLFIRCLEENERKVRVIKTLFLDPYSMRLVHKPVLVVMYPVVTEEGHWVRGVLMASLDLSSLVVKSFHGPLLSGWRMALLGQGGEVLWKSGEVRGVSRPLKKEKGIILVRMPFRVGDKEWSVVAEASDREVEAGVISFYRKVEGLTFAFLLVLALSLFSVFAEIRKGYKALALSEDRFRNLVEGMREVFYVRDSGGVVSYISPGTEEKLGVSPRRLREIIAAFPPSDIEVTVTVEGRSLAIRERGGEGVFYGLIRDVTLERKLSRKLERERRFLDSIVSSLGSGVMVMDDEMRVLWMNTYLKEMFHLEDQVEGAYCYTLFAQRRSPCPSCHVASVLGGVKDQEEMVRKYFVPLFGEERDFFVKTHRAKMEDGDRIVVICQDITETRRMEEKVYFMDKLSSLGKLAASVAHELSTPLFVTSTNLEAVLRKERLTPSARKLLEVSSEELRRSVLLLQKLRWVYRPISMEKEEVYIDGILKDVVAVLKTYARERKVGLNLEVTPVAPFQGYRGPLMQVLLNLVTNAVEASPPGSEVTLRAEEEDGTLVLTVRDRGAGIPPEIRERIFEPFVTSKGEKGAGLGLYLSYKLVESMGGTIEVESREGEGTIFRVRLPVQREEGDEG